VSVLGEAAIVRQRSVPFERTPQRLDPLGVQSAWMLVPILSVTAVAYAIYSTITHLDEVHEPVLAWLAVAWLALAAAVLAVRTHPARPPFGFWSHVSIIGSCVVAATLFSTAMWGTNHRIQDDWGQVVVAMFLTAMALYRPIVEVIAVAGLSALVVGATAALEGPFLSIATNPLVYFSVAATPIIALACAGCGYAWTMTGETLAWREVARASQARLEPELRETASRMVNQERITTLNQATVPFLADLLRRGEVTEVDARLARELAAGLRGASVAAVNRTWLGETLAQVLAARGEEASALQTRARVTDPDGLERIFSDEQRAVVGAILSTVAKLPGLDPASVQLEVRDPERPRFELDCRATDGRRRLRHQLLPFLSVLRSVGMTASMRVSDDQLTVRFSYPGGENR
jgi:hypothetical protein